MAHHNLALEPLPAVVVAVKEIVDCILARHTGRWWEHMGFAEHPQGVPRLGLAADETLFGAPVVGFGQCLQFACLYSVVRFSA